jgi:hypothetical protein
VVIVMPAFSECYHGKKEIVAALVAGFKTPGSPQMCERVDRERAVPQQHRREHESPQKNRVASHRKYGSPKQDGRNPVILVQQPEFPVPVKVVHDAAVIPAGLRRKKPSDMRPPETFIYWGMDIFGHIRVAMVHAMMCRPPQHTSLRARLGEKSQEKLRNAIEAEGAMAEVTMVAGRHGKHPDAIGDSQPRDIRPFEGGPEQKQARSMQRNKCDECIEMKSSESRDIRARKGTPCSHRLGINVEHAVAVLPLVKRPTATP